MMHTRPDLRGRGFTFIEVMFAVLVMGAGVAMIAAMLPVAVRQTRDLREQAAGNAVIESGFHLVEAQAIQDSRLGPAGLYGTLDGDASLPLMNNSERVWTYPSLDLLGAADFDTTTTGSPLSNLNNRFQAFDYEAGGTGFFFLGPPAFDATLASRVAVEPGRRVTVNSDPQVTVSAGRYAWIPFYRRESVADVDMAFVAVTARNVDAMSQLHFATPIDLITGGGAAPLVSLWNNPLPVEITYNEGSKLINGEVVEDVADTVIINPFGFDAGSNVMPPAALLQALVEDAAIVVYRPNNHPSQLTTDGIDPALSQIAIDSELYTVLRLGERVGDFEFEVAPESDLPAQLDETTGTPLIGVHDMAAQPAYLVGRMLRDPTAPWDETDNPFIGPSQVVGSLVDAGITLP